MRELVWKNDAADRRRVTGFPGSTSTCSSIQSRPHTVRDGSPWVVSDRPSLMACTMPTRPGTSAGSRSAS